MSAIKHLKDIITVVSGLPRSGTSMMMKMLQAGGLAPLEDGQRIADEDNPLGYFELERVKAMPKGDVAWLADAKGKVVKAISALLPHLPDTFRYNVVFVERAMTEILASQKKMLEHRGENPQEISDQKLAEHYINHLAETKRMLAGRPHTNVLYVRYNDVVVAPQVYASRINAFLGGDLNAEAMAASVKPELHRNRGEDRP